MAAQAAKRVVLVDATRIPFAAQGTIYKKHLAVDLSKLAIEGILSKTKLNPKEIDYLFYGQVIQEVRTANIAREAANAAGIPFSTPAHSLVMACISANQCFTTGAEKIISGQAEVVLAGGVETFSDVPIRLSRGLRLGLLGMQRDKPKNILGQLQSIKKNIKLKDIGIETPAIQNYTTAEVMGYASDRLASRFGVKREDQDRFSLQSHQRAAKAHADGIYDDEITPFEGSIKENLIKGDSTYEKLAKLKPAFVKPDGTHTAANSSQLTDGASAGIIMSEAKAKSLGYKPKSILKAWNYTGMDPYTELLLGPAYSINKLLKDNGLELKDIDVFEIHEAFAGQVLANIAALQSEKFCKENLGRTSKVGEIPMDKLNLHGGSLSLGHPFGATGTRLLLTASNRLRRENGRYAVVAACADGGLGHACLVERYD